MHTRGLEALAALQSLPSATRFAQRLPVLSVMSRTGRGIGSSRLDWELPRAIDRLRQFRMSLTTSPDCRRPHGRDAQQQARNSLNNVHRAVVGGLLSYPLLHDFGGTRRLAQMVIIVGHQAATSSTSVGSSSPWAMTGSVLIE
jgi:hypothetical protein